MWLRSSLRRLLNKPDGRLTTYGDRHRIAALLSLVPISLSRILAIFKSDKQRPGEHSYGESYEKLFRHLRYQRLKILEIGILKGDSLLAWRAYFPRAITVGFDIEDKCALAAGKKTRVYQGDQSSTVDIKRVCDAESPFDIVIDDGSHQSKHQLLSFLRVFPHVKDGGLYVIEDVQTSFWSGIMSGVQWDGRHITDPLFAETCYGWFLDLAKYTNHAEFATLDGVSVQKLELGQQIRCITFAHNMIIAEKAVNNEPSNIMRRVLMQSNTEQYQRHQSARSGKPVTQSPLYSVVAQAAATLAKATVARLANVQQSPHRDPNR